MVGLGNPYNCTCSWTFLHFPSIIFLLIHLTQNEKNENKSKEAEDKKTN